ncbi:MAG: 3-sulfolactaldehyde reductase [marine bacterium B5-7]|nr:MAG: 3-sulfolactaldehyde reductase [marine bacterium B5-7]
MLNVGFIGLGVMGSPMARHIAEAGHSLRVYDIDSNIRQTFANLTNCTVAATPAQAADDVDYLITMLPETKHVVDVLFGEDGAVEHLADNALVIEMSTGDATATPDIAGRLRRKGFRMIDVPVGRTPVDAHAGTLLALVGAEPAELEEVKPLLLCFCDEIVHAGPPGSGIKLKLVNNYMTMIGMVMTSETLMLAEKVGLDRDTVVHVLQNTVAGRGQINVNFPRKVLAGDITPDFPLRLGLKDLSLALDLARSVGAPLMLGGVSRELFSLARSLGRENQDCTAMLLLLEDLARCQTGSADNG